MNKALPDTNDNTQLCSLYNDSTEGPAADAAIVYARCSLSLRSELKLTSAFGLFGVVHLGVRPSFKLADVSVAVFGSPADSCLTNADPGVFCSNSPSNMQMLMQTTTRIVHCKRTIHFSTQNRDQSKQQ